MKQKRQKTGILEWLQFPKSFQFETDLPLEECIQRLYLLEGTFEKSLFSRSYTTVDHYYQDGYQHFGIRVKTRKGISIVVAEGIIWSERDLTFINGETRLSSFPAIIVLHVGLPLIMLIGGAYISAFLACIVLFTLSLGLNHHILNSLSSKLLHHLYDILDHENESRLALGEFEEFYGHTVLEKKKQNRGTLR